MSELWQLGLGELSACVARGEASCVEVVRASLDRVAAVDEQVGAFLLLRGEAALREASEADLARAKGAERGPFHGLPFAAKDNLVSPDLETSCASRILRGMRAPYEATVLTRLREAGMVAIGTTNMDEFAMGSSCENSSVRPTCNPWDLTRVPGGSSGGSAAAVAAREVPVALGSDTGGSIRQPAALCGVVGLKPTYGRVSRYGLVAFASSLDQVGALTHSVSDAALLLGLIAGNDPLDSTSLDAPVPDYTSELPGSVAGLRVGLPREFFVQEGLDLGTREALEAALATLEELGATPVELSLPLTEYAVAAYYLICTAEASSNLSRYDGVKYGLRVPGESLDEMYLNTRSSGFGAEVKRRILLGTFVLSAGYYDAYYRKAQQVRTLVRRDFEAAFEHCDLIATPTTPGPAWPLGERVDDPLAMYLSDVFTVSVNLGGLPALSVPCGRSGKLPVGLQLIGRPLDEPMLLRAADAFLEQTGFHRDTPGLSGTTA
ncbi:MAG: Asp-tRNA(Asn)/Glu-tRNA(Gln) amidotransferase subunit GatA [Myxococcota bacterium]|nr:Asp-tRNA(Asn)/Glu-tRNA(Gln) amidotransferase subunit GatA [Myxococcota bacterium]